MPDPSKHGFTSFGTDGKPTLLPLREVSARVCIVDTFAQVTLTQTYTNTGSGTSSPSFASQYVFPVPVGGAVCAFRMESSSGQIVNGVVKERSKAKKEYEMAVSDDRWAGLLYEATPDVFVMTMGAIAPREDIKVTITYVMELSDGDLPGYDHVEFRLQTYVDNRSGRPPTGLIRPSSLTCVTAFNITAEIQMTSKIVSISCPSHSVTVKRPDGPGTQTSMHSAVVSLDPNTLTLRPNRDFVLTIQSAKLDHPRCIAERRGSDRTVAMSLTFVPRFRLDPLPTQEYIFLVDRSSSMKSKNRLAEAKNALLIFLKSLPHNETTFNIFSFGRQSASMWPSSRKYTAATVDAALAHVNGMQADMGPGTEIGSALKDVFRCRNRLIPTAVFMLTDGHVWDNDTVFNLVEAEVATAAKGNDANGPRLRVFTLGVGAAASTSLCEGIARRGNGVYLMTGHSTDLASKCARLLAASIVPPLGSVGDVSIDWGYVPGVKSTSARSAGHGTYHWVSDRYADSHSSQTSFFDEDYDPLVQLKNVNLPDPPKVQQAPTEVPDLYPANRFSVYAILSDTDQIPRRVILRGMLPNGTELSLPIDVYEYKAPQGQIGNFPSSLIHTLTANRLITELEDGNTASQGALSNMVDKEAVIEAAVVRLSERYQLASRFASFIAVDEGIRRTSAYEDVSSLASSEPASETVLWVDAGGADGRSELYVTPRTSMSLSVAREDSDDDIQDGKEIPDGVAPALSQLSLGAAPSTETYLGDSSTQSDAAGSLFGRAMQSTSSRHLGRERTLATVKHASVSSLEYRGGGIGITSPLPPPPSRRLAGPLLGLPPPQELVLRESSPSTLARVNTGRLAATATPTPKGAAPPTYITAQLQRYDGSFELDDRLCMLLGRGFDTTVLKSAIPQRICDLLGVGAVLESERIWATIIAAAYMKVRLAEDKEVWMGLWKKAANYVQAKLLEGADRSVSFAELVEEASRFV